ncbi:hypothetical protein B0T22DRAFT_540097 [Podospora appendiculata]|uniref:Uncharacterized protein n=1 Tax=Podospora appendiculata TaxID=314037 RepID=A0AAE1C7Q4_9PEZI|nr:hypothetical protein B0T22DRAFT_540097 [Podospora appendiculata]
MPLIHVPLPGFLSRRWPFATKPYRVPPRRLPFSFRRCPLMAHIGTQLGILAAIGGLWAVSERHNGIASVPTTPSEISLFWAGDVSVSLLWTYTLLWTALPAFLMARYSEYFSAMQEALKTSQPIMELCKPSGLERICSRCHQVHRWQTWTRCNPLPLFLKYGHFSKREHRKRASPKQTILLDYSKIHYSIPLVNSCVALRNRHFLVATCMFVKFLLSIISGLVAAIFSVAIVSASSPLPLVIPNMFYAWGPAESSLRPALDIVSASVVNTAPLIQWMTPTHAFHPFSVTPASSAALDGAGDAWNITAETTAYAMTLECDMLDPRVISAAGGITIDGTVGKDAQVVFNFTHRDCAVYKAISLMTPEALNMISFAETACSWASKSARVGFIAGATDPNSQIGLSNFTLASCIPSFTQSTASITVRAADTPGQVLSSTILASNTSQVSFGLTAYIDRVPLYTAVDPKSSNLQMDNIGRLSYDHSKAHTNPASPLDSAGLTSAFETIFTAVFAASATLTAFNNASTDPGPQFLLGSLAKPENRLFVVWRPAAVVMAVVFAALLATLWVAWYAHANADILRNQEQLILGHALMVDRCPGVAQYIDDLKADAVQHLRAEEKARCAREGVEYKPDMKSDDELLKGRSMVEHAAHLDEEWECSLDGDKIRLGKVSGFLGYYGTDQSASGSLQSNE